MFYILHGDDISASRNYLTQLVGNKTPIILDGKSVHFSAIEESLVSSDLFGGEKIIILEFLLSKNKKKREITLKLAEMNPQVDIVFFEETKLSPTLLGLLKRAEVKAFLLPQFYFQLLDSFAPGNSQYIFGLYHQVLHTTAPELVFYSLMKRVRQLVILQMGDLKNSKDLAVLQGWQVEKLRKQLARWSQNGLIEMYKALQNTEIKLKSGGLPVGLSKELDILILTHLR